jgi:hypothetical protein
LNVRGLRPSFAADKLKSDFRAYGHTIGPLTKPADVEEDALGRIWCARQGLDETETSTLVK